MQTLKFTLEIIVQWIVNANPNYLVMNANSEVVNADSYFEL